MSLLLRVSCAFALTASLLLACDSSDDTDASPGGGTSSGGTSSGSSGSSGTSGGGTGACLDPASFNYVVPLQTEADGTNFVVYSATPDGTQAFFSTVDRVHRLDLTTNAVTDLYAPPNAIAPSHFVRTGDVLVKSGKKLWSLPKTGGTETAKPDWTRVTAGSLAGTSEVALDGDTFYALESGNSGAVFSHNADTGEEKLLGAEPRSEFSSIRLGPDAVYSYYPNDPDANNSPTTMWKVLKTGGAVTPITITGAPSDVNYPVAVIGNDLYVFSVVQAEFKAYLLKVSRDGGAATTIGSVMFVLGFKGQVKLQPASGGLLLMVVDDFYWVADGSSSLTKLACVSDPYHAYAPFTVDKSLYLNVLDAPKGGIIKLPLP